MNQIRICAIRALRNVVLHRSFCTLLLLSFVCGGMAMPDESERRKDTQTPHQVAVRDNIKNWKITLTVGGGGGLEAVRKGWHSVEVPAVGSAIVRKHHSVDTTDINPNALVIFNDTITADQRTAVFRAAADALNDFELQRNVPGGSVSEDGWRVSLKMTTRRREISVSARELSDVRDAGEDFTRLIQEINKFLPAKAAIRLD
ncbi:MAG: hypothetical protein HY290_31050 [Planctomycetia bacterium]|nr:hypothetical protein [Planctomycetia bacterium]